MTLERLSGGMRSRAIAETLEIAEPAARSLGVTRCVDVTRMDRVGIPVFSATRPRAPIVCVTAGKGAAPLEAKAGALMEAIEQQVAYDEGTLVEPRWMSPADVARSGGPRLGELAPRLGAPLDVDASMPWLLAEDVTDPSRRMPVPVESVLTPCPASWSTGTFGSTTNGLASGNTVDEAVLHGLCEVLERDVTAFQALRPTSLLVDPATLPGRLAELYDRLNANGLRAWLRWVPTETGIAYFSAMVVDDDLPTPLFCNGGYGAHPVAEIAASRALTEAAQSRVTLIQGARDDLSELHTFFARRSSAEVADYRARLIALHSAEAAGVVDFRAIRSAHAAAPRELTVALVSSLAAAGLGRPLVYRYRASPPRLAVVRVIVPGAEQLRNATPRAGRRLVHHARALRQAGVVDA